MKKHNGMRPLDIAILLKIAVKGSEKWYMKDLAYELVISASEISESINRSVYAGLISTNKKTINKLALFDFINSGLRYAFPQKPGAISRGIGTAHSAPPLNNHIISNEQFVWPYAKGEMRGLSIEPLYPKLPEACLKDRPFYEFMALIDAIRAGKAREHELAAKILKEKLEYA